MQQALQKCHFGEIGDLMLSSKFNMSAIIYFNTESFDKVNVKIKWCNFFGSHHTENA